MRHIAITLLLLTACHDERDTGDNSNDDSSTGGLDKAAPEVDDESGSSSESGDGLSPVGPDAFHWPRRPTHPGPCDRPRPALQVTP